MSEENPIIPKPLPRLKPLRVPKQAWTDETEISTPPSEGGMLSPLPMEGLRIAQPNESASMERTPETSNVEDLRETIEELRQNRPISPSSSSASSKRTSISAEMNAQIRTRIRKQAKTMVQKKRGSVQLAKRLLRSQTLTKMEETSEAPEDFNVLDQQIEAYIEKGKRFNTSEAANSAPEIAQKEFFEDDEAAAKESNKKPSAIFYSRSIPRTQKDADKFRAMLRTYGRLGIPDTEIKDPYAKIGMQIFAASPPRDFSVFFQREGINYQPWKEAFQRLDRILVENNTKQERPVDADLGLVEYTKAINWSEFVEGHVRPTLEFFEFSLDLNRIEFEHHWLFTIEDKLVRKIKTYHHELTSAGTKAMKVMEQYLMEKVTTEIRILSEEQRASAFQHLNLLEGEFLKLSTFYQNLSARIKQAWRELTEERKRIKTPSTKLSLKEAKLPPTIDLEYLPESIREFTRLPVFVLENVEIKDLPNPQKTLTKIRIQVLIFFNDTLVCRTPPMKMNSEFSVDFRKVYQLRIYEPPEKVMLLIRELQPGHGWVELSRVYIPFPDDQKEMEEIDFGSDIVVEKTPKTLGCGHPDRKSQCLQGKIFCKLRWTQPNLEKLFKKSFLQKSEEDSPKPFELIPSEVRLVSDEEFAADLRLEALTKRYKNSHSFRDTQKWIGLTAAEIDSHWALDDSRDDDISGALDFSMDAMRKAGIKYAAMIRKNLIESFSRDKRLKSYEDIVKEDILPAGFSGFGTLFGHVDLSRKLKPMRALAGRNQIHSKKIKLVLNIQFAANLPERIDKKAMNVLIEATFQSSIARTSAVSGKNANWQQTLILDIDEMFDIHHDLKSITDVLELNLYDKQINKLPHDSREPNTIHEQFEHSWLGRVLIPFSTILSLTKIDGVITIKEPLFFTGYKLHKHKAYLKVMITMDPPITAPLFSSYENFLPGETSTLMADCRRFESRNKQLFPSRRFVTLVNDSNGKRILASRYLRPIKPPYQIQEILTNSNNMIEAINLTAHIVSCIPFIADPIMFPGIVDLWTSTEQLLTIGCGDEEEHAVLLVCWLLHLQLSTALILGQALPEGPKSAYVLVEVEQSTPLLVNPSDGNVYSISDPLCPLISIGTIVTQENIFANIQKPSHPCLMDFDLKNKSNWDPLFASPRHDLSSIQPTELTYTAVNEDILVELRSNLEREIKLTFDEARRHAIPQWNLMASRALREILSEGSTGSGYDFDIEHRLGQLLSSYKVTVVAFRSPYISRQHLIQEVLKTNMHINSNKDVQFALSIHIQPFINNLISCSVAIASLLPKYL